jgi:hypothetical protein
MLICEITATASPDKLVALSQLIKGRMKNTAANASVSVDAFLAMARSIGFTIDRESLTDLISKPPLSNLINGVQGNEIQFHGVNDGTDQVASPNDKANAEKRVAAMAKKQIKK